MKITREVSLELEGFEGLIAVGLASYYDGQSSSPTIYLQTLPSLRGGHDHLLQEVLLARTIRALNSFNEPDYGFVAEEVPALCLSVENERERLGAIIVTTAVSGEASLSHDDMVEHIIARMNHILLSQESTAWIRKVRGRLLNGAPIVSYSY